MNSVDWPAGGGPSIALVNVVALVTSILAVGFLIIFHEAGHYLAAKWGGMKVSRFSVGFGPVIYRYQGAETEFVLSSIPLGGYVAIDGMNPEDEAEADDPRSFQNRPFAAKFGAVLAGPAANYLLAFILFFFFYAFFNAVEAPPVRVVDVIDEQAAMEAGLQKDDLLVGADGTPFVAMQDLDDAIQGSDGSVVRFDVRRDGRDLVVPVQPRPMGGRYLIGIRLQGTEWESDPLGIWGGLSTAGRALWVQSGRMLDQLAALPALLFSGGGVKAVDGPIGIVKGLADSVERSSVGALRLIASLSLMLGLFNLLPIPALDGARLMFLLIGAVRRKPVEPRLENWVHLAGFILLFGLLLVVSVNDVFE